jgi:hypothetical protein
VISRALAKWLDAAELVTYDPTGTSGDCFLEHLPDAPDAAVMVLSTGGNPLRAAATYGWDEPTVQLMVRGGPEDPETPAASAQELYDELQGLRYVTLDPGGEDELRLCLCSSLQTAPFNLGRDEKARYRYTLNFALHVRRVTTHRD